MERHAVRLMVALSLVALPASAPGALLDRCLCWTTVFETGAGNQAEIDAIEPVESSFAEEPARHEQQWKETIPDADYRSAIEAMLHAEGWRSSPSAPNSGPIPVIGRDDSDQTGYWEQAVADAGGPDFPSDWVETSEIEPRPTSAPRARIVSVQAAGAWKSAERSRVPQYQVAEHWRPDATPTH